MPPATLFDITGIDLNHVLHNQDEVRAINPQRDEFEMLNGVNWVDHPNGRVIGYKEPVVTKERVVERQPVVVRKKGGFGWGLFFGLAIVIIGIVAFAYNNGSFEGAGQRADQVTAQVEQKTGDAAHQAARSLDNAGDQAQQTAQQTQQNSQ